MNPLVTQLIILVVGAGIGFLVKHIWPSSSPTPADPLNGLPDHPLLNSPILTALLTQMEQGVLQGVRDHANRIMTPPVKN